MEWSTLQQDWMKYWTGILHTTFCCRVSWCSGPQPFWHQVSWKTIFGAWGGGGRNNTQTRSLACAVYSRVHLAASRYVAWFLTDQGLVRVHNLGVGDSSWWSLWLSSKELLDFYTFFMTSHTRKTFGIEKKERLEEWRFHLLKDNIIGV